MKTWGWQSENGDMGTIDAPSSWDALELLRVDRPEEHIHVFAAPLTIQAEEVQPVSTPAGDLLNHVAGIVNGVRNRTHGNKERSFAGIAKAWTRLFDHPFKGSDVARAMVALKEQRMRFGDQSPEAQREHVEDILGYWAIYYELRAAELKEESPD